QLDSVDKDLRLILSNERIRSIVDLVPDEWLAGDEAFQSTAEHREMYVQFLETRLAHSENFIKEAQHAGKSLI
ncbi:MAG: aminotransferase class I and II, partial [Ferruginibacter sp.]